MGSTPTRNCREGYSLPIGLQQKLYTFPFTKDAPVDEISIEPYSLNVITRDMEPRDIPCIYSTWRNSAYYGSKKDHVQPAKIFFKMQTVKIKSILDKSQTKIACLEEDPDLIIGYVVWSGTHLDWIYVKADYRLKGIGGLLLPKGIDTVSSELTKIGKVIAKKKNFKLKENEYATRNP